MVRWIKAERSPEGRINLLVCIDKSLSIEQVLLASKRNLVYKSILGRYSFLDFVNLCFIAQSESFLDNNLFIYVKNWQNTSNIDKRIF